MSKVTVILGIVICLAVGYGLGYISRPLLESDPRLSVVATAPTETPTPIPSPTATATPTPAPYPRPMSSQHLLTCLLDRDSMSQLEHGHLAAALDR